MLKDLKRMALSLSITGILAIVVVVLALIIVLLGMTGRVKRLNSQLKIVEDDIITPYLKTTVHYRKSDFTDESKLNALNKISKQFFRDTFRFSGEKTFDEIGNISQDSDIKNFCNLMGIIRYSKTVKKSDIELLYRNFENILVKRRPASAAVLNDSSPDRKTMTLQDLNNRKLRKDIVDIKSELDKMKTQEPLNTPVQPQPQPSAVSTPNVSPGPTQTDTSHSLVKFSVDERLSQMEEEIDKTSIHESQPSNDVNTNAQNSLASQSPVSQQPSHSINPPTRPVPVINPNKVISTLVRGSRVESLKPQRQQVMKKAPVSLSPYQARSSSKSSKKLSFDKLRINSDELLSSEINNLNQRIQKLLDTETNRQLGEVGRY